MIWAVRCALAAVAFYSVAADEDSEGANLQSFVDTNPSINSTELSGCPAGTIAASAGESADVCANCPDGRTTEVWSLQPSGALGCTVPGDDDDGEDSDDWIPSLAACKSTCVGTCPGIVWTEPASPTSCLKCSAETEWSVPSGPLVQVHKRVASGATLARHCNFCTDGLTLVNDECEKTGVCSTIGPVPYYKVSGACMPCPPQEDVGTPLQIIVVLCLVGAAGAGIWLGSATAALDDAAGGEEGVAVAASIGPLAESIGILLPTFQFIATAFSFDFSWPAAVRSLGSFMKAVFVGSFADVAAPECVFSYGAYKDDDRYLSVLGLKFGMFLIMALMFGILAAATRSARAIGALAGSYSAFLLLIASACFTAIDVTELPDGNYALKTLPSITSQTDDFGAMVAYGVFGLLLFLCVIPGVFLMQLKKASDTNTLWTAETQARFGTLFMKYRASCWWFEFNVMSRKILLAAIAILTSSALTALLLSAIVIAMSIAAHIKYKPYQAGGHRVISGADGAATHDKDTEDYYATGDKLELICMATLLFVYLVGGLSAAMEPEDGSAGATIVTILAVFALIFPVAATAFIQNQGDSSSGDAEDSKDGATFELEETGSEVE